ncbi:hypothetical protein O181_036457 [Austropuccinia psidii MF-1]|uniref:Cryptic loci regulator 2 N-terminal domain-containing protein n=1 Tax=Austropuccinia psidii MF-1 TaxID=1389203 RepID=A0A9Q3DAS4_9BASI|nr:hypothetical protein [Austropuccinia psidii MF-1]
MQSHKSSSNRTTDKKSYLRSQSELRPNRIDNKRSSVERSLSTRTPYIKTFTPHVTSTGLHQITFLASDGDFSQPPSIDLQNSQSKVKTPSGWLPIENKSNVKKKWLQILGQEIALHFSLVKGREKWSLTEFPEGYRLFDHCKGSTRSTYLFGYPKKANITRKFLTPNEFLPHLKWLASPDRLGQNCLCKNCQSVARRPENTHLRIRFPHNKIKSRKPQNSLKNATQEPCGEQESLSNFRRYELVWCELDSTDLKIKFEAKYWPGICQSREVTFETFQVFDISDDDNFIDLTSENNSQKSIHPKSTDKSSQAKKLIEEKHYWWVQLLGVSDSLKKTESQILPWLFRPLKEEDWTAVSTGKLCVPDYLRESTQPLPTLASLCNPVISRLSFQLAIQIAACIEEVWTPSDKSCDGLDCLGDWEKFRRHALKSDSSQSPSKTFWRGVWLGAERIWTKDLVRLNKIGTWVDNCSDTDIFLEDRLLFFKISFFWKSAELGPVVAAGRIFELLALSQGSSSLPFAPETKAAKHFKNLSLIRCADPIPHTFDIGGPDELPPPPKGFKFCSITPEHSLHHIELNCIAGRYYSPKIPHETLARLRRQFSTVFQQRRTISKPEFGKSTKLASLLGFTEGNFMKFTKMNISRERTVYHAIKSSKKSMSIHFRDKGSYREPSIWIQKKNQRPVAYLYPPQRAFESSTT